jgi:hypothetical protein
MATILTKLKRLDATVFENLVYDLLTRRGLSNAMWRTPGADGGRDIEGQFVVMDLSGTLRIERWYVECKRYSASIDWPTLSQKLAYAENHHADYLLLCTTATLSNPCRNEIALRDRRGMRPYVRAWEGHDLANLIARDELLSVKYGFARTEPARHVATLPLLWLAAKSIQDAYGSAAIHGEDRPSLEAAAALAELAVVQAEALVSARSTVFAFVGTRDGYSWCRCGAGTDLKAFDRYGLRAVLAVMRLFSGANVVRLTVGSARYPQTTNNRRRRLPSRTLSISPGPTPSRAFTNAMNAITIAANLEWRRTRDAVIVISRVPLA